jgi:hypothetical protein
MAEPASKAMVQGSNFPKDRLEVGMIMNSSWVETLI